MHDSATRNEQIELRKNALRCRRAVDERFYENAFLQKSKFHEYFLKFRAKIKNEESDDQKQYYYQVKSFKVALTNEEINQKTRFLTVFCVFLHVGGTNRYCTTQSKYNFNTYIFLI